MTASASIVVCCLLACAVAVSAVPAGFTTFFFSSECPDGWYPLVTSRGRVVVSVADGSQAGVTVNEPLASAEDRTHNHTYETSVHLPSKSIAAIDCCNDMGAQNNNYAVGGTTTDSDSALPFVQLPLCTLSAENSDPVPFGTIAFFDPSVSSCPPQWSPMTEANGRVIIPGYADKGIITSNAAPLASGEDRKHSHAYSTNVQTVDVSYAGAEGCCNGNPAADGSYPVAGTSSEESTGLPYVQLLTCLAQAPTFEANFPAATLLFNEVGCPPNWNISLEASGRFVVGLPNGAEAGVTFGGASLPPGDVSNPSHSHNFAGSFTAPPAGVGLADGCCGDGYAAAQSYSFAGTTAADAFNLPYLSVPMCMQL